MPTQVRGVSSDIASTIKLTKVLSLPIGGAPGLTRNRRVGRIAMPYWATAAGGLMVARRGEAQGSSPREGAFFASNDASPPRVQSHGASSLLSSERNPYHGSGR